MLKKGARCFNRDPSKKKKEHKKFSKNKKIV